MLRTTFQLLLLVPFVVALDLPILDDSPLGSDFNPADIAVNILSPSSLGKASVVPENYIVVFKKDATQAAIKAHKSTIDTLQAASLKKGQTKTKGRKNSFDLGQLAGYSGSFAPDTLKAITSSSVVDYVEADSMRYITDVQTDSEWNLERISQAGPAASSGPYTYSYPKSAGAGTTVYVLDTGVDITHPEFQGRASFGYNAIGDGLDHDAIGHGTHCAGIIGSYNYGVAKKASIVAVKVFNDTSYGTSASVLAGIDWVCNNQKNGSSSIISMSLSGGYSQALNDGINNAAAHGVTVVVAAGNSGVDTSTTSPGSASGAIAVGAIDINDYKPPWSNYGPAVALFAPGANILSTYPDDQLAYMSGTSMACPHVAGLAALLVTQNGGVMAPSDLRKLIVSSASPASIYSGGYGSPNLVAYNGGEGSASPSPTTSASVTSTTSRSSTTTSTLVSTSSEVVSTSTPVSTSASSIINTSKAVSTTLRTVTSTTTSMAIKSTSTSSSSKTSTSSISTPPKQTHTPPPPRRCTYWEYFYNRCRY